MQFLDDLLRRRLDALPLDHGRRVAQDRELGEGVRGRSGQELLDLKSALDSGAITQDEYDEQREKILDKD